VKKKEAPVSKTATKAKITPAPKTKETKVKEEKTPKAPVAAKIPVLNSTDSESGKVARPTTRKTRGEFFFYFCIDPVREEHRTRIRNFSNLRIVMVKFERCYN
jgi:hypothetical protein